ncbi:MAG: SRPBCC family protein [Nitrososphaeraceae archaeon]
MSDITVSSSSIINGPAEKVWKTLRAFGGFESFNPLVTSSELEGAVVSVGCKRVCYVSLDSGKNVLRTEEVLNPLDDQNRTMSYTVTSAPGTHRILLRFLF